MGVLGVQRGPTGFVHCCPCAPMWSSNLCACVSPQGASTRTNGVAAAVKAEEEENASGRDRDGMEQDATEDGAAAKGPSPAHGQSPGQASPTSDSQPQGLRVSKRIRKKPRLSLYSDDDGDADEAAPATAAAARVRSRSGGGGGGASGAAAAAAAAAAGGGAAPAGGLHGLLVLALAAAADDPKPGGGGPGAAREDDDDDSVEDHGGKRAAGHGSAQHGRGAGRGGAAARGRGGASPIAPPAAAAALPAATLRAPFVTSRNRAPAAAAAAAAAAAGAPMARGVVSPAVLEEITAQNISMFFDQPARTVARNLGVSLSFFKKRCRLLGIARWPQRKLHSLDRAAQAVREDISLTIFEREVRGCAMGCVGYRYALGCVGAWGVRPGKLYLLLTVTYHGSTFLPSVKAKCNSARPVGNALACGGCGHAPPATSTPAP